MAAAALLLACGEGPTPPGAPAELRLTVENLPSPEAAQGGEYEAWAIAADGSVHSAGRFDPGSGQASLTSPLAEPEFVMITWEPPGDGDDRPSQQKLIGGRVVDGTADLGINRYLTAGVPLVEEPGTHVLFTPSDNAELGYPSNEDAGIWVFNIKGDTASGEFYLRYSNLSRGWQYEGWMVRDHGTEDACWLSYGKFEPDANGRLTNRDDTGLGPYSGKLDYERAMPEEIVFPGDDWVANPLGLPKPCGLDLPLDLNGEPALGIESRWTHVVTVEPATEEDEPHLEREPFFLRPYRNPIGEGPADEPRTVEFYPESLPRGTATLVPGGG